MVSYREDFVAGRRGHDRGLWEVLTGDRAVRSTVILLAAIVAFFVLMDIVLRSLYNADGTVPAVVHRLYMFLSIGRDNTLAEIFNHGVAFSAAILFFAAAAASRSRVCLALAGFMGIAWLDDSAQYHERIGRAFGARFPEIKAFGVGAVHIGELVAWCTIGIVLLAMILWSSRRVLAGDRTVLRLAMPLILLLIFCAVIVDVVHVPFAGTPFDAAFMYLEDGGEMIAVALIATLALYLARNAESVYGIR